MDRLSCVRTFTRLFDAFATPDNGVSKEEGEGYPLLIEMWFQFAIIWGIGGPLDEDGRKKFDAFMRELDTRCVGTAAACGNALADPTCTAPK
jgi:dynein heavy chain